VGRGRDQPGISLGLSRMSAQDINEKEAKLHFNMAV
jgi:hypothetical protein